MNANGDHAPGADRVLAKELANLHDRLVLAGIAARARGLHDLEDVLTRAAESAWSWSGQLTDGEDDR
jgi:hypothetical protein